MAGIANGLCCISFNIGMLTSVRRSMALQGAHVVEHVAVRWALFPKLWGVAVSFCFPITMMTGLHHDFNTLTTAGWHQHVTAGYVAPEVLFRFFRLTSWVCLCFVCDGWAFFEAELWEPTVAVKRDLVTCRAQGLSLGCTFSQQHEASRAFYRAGLLSVAFLFVSLDLMIGLVSFTVNPVHRGADSNVELAREVKAKELEIQSWALWRERLQLEKACTVMPEPPDAPSARSSKQYSDDGTIEESM